VLEPLHATNYEAGIRGRVGRFRYEAAGFLVRVRDELISFQGVSDRIFFRNAGKSRHRGIELGGAVGPAGGVTFGFTYTYADIAFTDYATDGAVFDGHEVPGIPPHRGGVRLEYRHPSGLRTVWETRFETAYFVDDGNTEQTESFSLSNLRAGYDLDAGAWRVSPFVGINNIFDTVHTASITINARGARYYEPGTQFDIYGGLTLRYHML